MNKRCVGLFIVSFLWMSKLTYDQQQYIQSIDDLKSQVTRTEQSINHINDQMVAMQRQGQSAPAQKITKEKLKQSDVQSGVTIQSPIVINPVLPVQQSLELIQFAVDQHENVYALEHLQQLLQSLDKYNISSALKQSLYASLEGDQKLIEASNQQQLSQQAYANKLLAQIDQQFFKILDTNVENYQPVQAQSFWEKIISIQPLKQNPTDLISQRLVVKEAQLRLVLARQMLNLGQYDQYVASLDDILILLNQAPRFNQPMVRQALEQAKSISFNGTPKLHTPILLD
ncbi:hypothetical protein P256_01922 [Acinetobacter nectaris CIP 110549]|uniref:Uncharacterized protein n=1 Tax=Acinetobacter nectaris CIP 110549 TaxID=1392540 RepID=V2T7W4_9GAMM|nr:hypothetical protein [Acinetobacter nectaris]ESK38383.1 hypothetical protein P256_01922 [Acinetobacter nectaris CIP 110549]